MGKDEENPLVSAFSGWYKKLNHRDCDSFDRLSNRHTIAMLVASSAVLALKSYMSDSIDCFIPAEFKVNHDNWIKYTDNYCWVKNTYYIPNQARLPGPGGNPEDVGGNEIKYYQWVPIIKAFMIFMFSIPAKFWGFSMWLSGYNVERLIEMLSKDENMDPEKRDKTTEYITAQMSRHIGYQRALGRTQKVNLGSSYGKFLTIMYMVTKVLYIAVPISLIFLLGAFMGPGYHDYGIRAINGLIHDETGDYIDNPMFPRKAICDFEIRGLGQNLRRYTAECVLPVNLFNDKIFLMYWWWFLILACLSFLGLISLLLKNRPGGNVAFVEKYLYLMRVADPESESDSVDIRRFTDEYLNSDGVLCMRLIALNTMDVVAGEIVGQLFTKWKEDQGSMRKEN